MKQKVEKIDKRLYTLLYYLSFNDFIYFCYLAVLSLINKEFFLVIQKVKHLSKCFLALQCLKHSKNRVNHFDL